MHMHVAWSVNPRQKCFQLSSQYKELSKATQYNKSSVVEAGDVISFVQGSYRILTVIFQDKITPFSRLFEALCSSLCEQRTLQNWLLNAEISNVFFYSKYQMGLKFLNSELQMLCVMNCKKILTNASVINSVKDSCIFQVNITVSRIFPDFSIPMIIFKTFQGLQNFYIKFQDFLYFSRICTNPVHTVCWWYLVVPH